MNDRNGKPTDQCAVVAATEGNADAERSRLSALRQARRRFLFRTSVLGTGVTIAPAAFAQPAITKMTFTPSVPVAPAAVGHPTITNMTVTPSSLPPGGGNVVVDATVSADTALLTLNRTPTTLPATVRVNSTSTLTLAAYDAPTTASATVTVAPATATNYSLTNTGPVYPYNEWFDHVVNAQGRIIYSGQANKASYGQGNNAIWVYDPVADQERVIYPDNGNKQGWQSGEIFVRFYVPGLNLFIAQSLVVFDLTANRILASDIVWSKAAAGISDGDTTPPYNSVFATEGSLWNNWMASTPGQAAHDWCASQDVGIALGSYGGPTGVAVLIWKNSAYPATSNQPLKLKCVYMPLSSRHPDDPTRLGYPIRAQSAAKCRGDWLYVFGPLFRADYGSLDLTQRRTVAMRLNVATFMATPADQRVPDSACELLPNIPLDSTKGGAICAVSTTSYDSTRDRFRLFNYKALEFDPIANVYSDVTPVGYPTVAGWCVAYTNGAHYLSGGHRALDDANAAYYLPSPPNSPPFTNGNPIYTDALCFAKIT